MYFQLSKLFWMHSEKGSTLKEKNRSRFFPLRVDPLSEGTKCGES